jgi:hypothetical protein
LLWCAAASCQTNFGSGGVYGEHSAYMLSYVRKSDVASTLQLVCFLSLSQLFTCNLFSFDAIICDKCSSFGPNHFLDCVTLHPESGDGR